ncbi:MAG TPA: amidohydrolase family protein [Acidobacteriota bacterium]
MRFSHILTVAALIFSCLLSARLAFAQELTIIQGGLLIDGTGRAPLQNSQVVIRGNQIEHVGPLGSFPIPAGARRIDARGKTILPGFVDLHFHIADDPTLVPLFVARGVTSARDPGAWIEYFEPVKQWEQANGIAAPRLFLCGPHLDGPGPAYPADSVVILSPEEARLRVQRQVAQGATAIKVYFRLPLASIRAAAEEAHLLEIPVTAHLEIIDVRDAVEAGVNGIEHITSLGLPLVPPIEAEKYRQAVLANNDARRMGRYRMWASIDPHSQAALDLARFLSARKIFVDPTLAVFERQPGDKGEEIDMMVRAVANMKTYVGVLHQAGVPIVVGSHSDVPHAARGLAYHRELELLVESGLKPIDVLVAATKTGAQFLGRDRDLGTIEKGKLADILIVDGNPLQDIRNARNVSVVIADGRVIDPKQIPQLTVTKK